MVVWVEPPKDHLFMQLINTVGRFNSDGELEWEELGKELRTVFYTSPG